MKTWKLRINGKEVETSKTIDVINPYTRELLAKVCQADESHYEDAVISAQKAFEVTRKLPAYVRSESLRRIAEILKKRHEEISNILSKETGKPIILARTEVDRGINTFELAAAYAITNEGEVLNPDIIKYGENKTTIVKRFPLGVIGAIAPYNWPLNLVAHKVAPAILAGNTIVLKPASATPLTSLLLADICKEANLPDGQINVIPCPVSVAQKLVVDERIKLVTFTGSPAVGWDMKSKCGTKKICLELGGNAAVVVEPETDYEKIIPRLVLGSFNYAGQVCISIQRILVHEKIFNKFKEKFISETKKLQLFDIADEKVICGPMINEKEAIRVESWVNEAIKEGATLLIGGDRVGNCCYPTVLTNTTFSMKVNTEEIFGPVVTLEKYSDFKDAIKTVNNSQFGIHAGVYTKDITKAFYAYNELDVGGVVINDFPTFRVDIIPYGGVKNSGFGREGIKFAYEEMTEIKHMTIHLKP